MGTSITSHQIRDLTVDTVDIADAAVTETKLATDAVTTVKIEDLAVTDAKLAGDISTAKLAEGALFFKDGDTITIQSGSVLSTEEQVLVETTTEAVTVDDPEPTLSTDGVAIDGYVRWAVSNTTFTTAGFQGWGYITGFGWVKLVDVVGFVANGSSLSGLADARGASRFYMQVVDSAATSLNEAHMLSGATFTNPSVSEVSLVPSGIDGKARIPVSSGSDLLQIVVSPTLTAGLTVSGAGGLDTGSEASSTGYDLRLITKALGVDPALLFTVSGNAITLPGTYTYQSDVLWFVRNDNSSDIESFFDAGQGWCTYNAAFKGVQVLFEGTAATYTAIDFSNFIPEGALEARLLYYASYYGEGLAGEGAFLVNDAINSLVYIQNITDVSDEEFFTLALDMGPTTSLKYFVDSTVKLNVRVVSWKLRRN